VNAAPFIERYGLIGVCLTMVAAFGFILPHAFLTWTNFAVLLASQSPALLLALALIIPLTAGDYDLSAGSVMSLSSMTLAILNVWHGMSIPWATCLAITTGLVVGIVNAFLIVYLRIPSLVATLATASLSSGVVQWASGSATISGISSRFVDAVIGDRLFGVAYAFYYALLAAAVIWYVLEFTPNGRRLLFVGRGREVARLNGINVARTRSGALLASSALAAMAGVVYAGVLGAADPSSGTSFLLPAFAAAFLGATSIVPGYFNAWGTVFAVYFLAIGVNGLSMIGIPLWVTNVFNGAALIVAVTLSQLARGREEIHGVE